MLISSHEERLLNLCSLLAGQESYYGVQLPTNRDSKIALESSAVEVATEPDKIKEVGKYYVTLISDRRCIFWYLVVVETGMALEHSKWTILYFFRMVMISHGSIQ